MFKWDAVTGVVHDHVIFYCRCRRKVGECRCPYKKSKEVVRFDHCTHKESREEKKG